MSEKSLKVITELLNEEKWTRAALNSYTINNFRELDTIIEETVKESAEDEVKTLCDEHLTHTKNSIIALYIAGIISLSRQLVDDSNIIMLINIFSDNRKWNIVEYLCERILEFGENKLALRTLSECFENEGYEEKKFAVWERLIKVDYEDADIVRHLAEKREEEDNIESAVDYYKKAIHRYINKKSFANVKEIWHKLIEFCPEDTDFFFHIDRKVAKIISGERSSQLLEDLFSYFTEQENWDKALEILKRIISYDPKNQWARNEIINCFRQKYSHHSHLEDYIRFSNLNQSWRNVNDAISDFEKHISFDAGNFVFHRSWGVGRIKSIQDDVIIIDFSRKRGHQMSLKMAVNALTSLIKDHIWVLKSTWKKEKLRERVKGDVHWTLKTVIRSYNNAASIKQLKAELVPGILTAGEWSSWSTEARKILKTDSAFGNVPDKLDVFVVREIPISFEEKTFNKFKAEKNFFARLTTIQDFLQHANPESEFFEEMFAFLTGFLKAFSTVNETVISSYLIIKSIVKSYPFLNPGFNYSFDDLFSKIENLEETFSAIEDTDIKKQFLLHIKKEEKNWQDLFVRLFPYYLSKFIIDELEAAGAENRIKELIFGIIDNYREKREAFIWIARNIDMETWTAGKGIQYEKILIGMVHLLNITFREIDNRRDVSPNRKINKQIQNYLFKEVNLENFLLKADEESISRLFTLVEDVKDLDASIKIELKHKIIEKFPDFKFYGETETETVSRGLLVTAASYKLKQKELQHIIEVDIPENSKEIGAAIQLGDLSENAEYKAGKERQELLNIAIGKLKDDLEKARIFKVEDVDTAQVSFGTVVDLKNIDSGKNEKYTFLGPWESDPNRNIISYLSPFGNKFWNHEVGEKLEFVINDRQYHYEVVSIEKTTI